MNILLVILYINNIIIIFNALINWVNIKCDDNIDFISHNIE